MKKRDVSIKEELNSENILNTASRVIDIEINGLTSVRNKLGQSFVKSVYKIVNSQGRVIICGMGKSGIIGKKISASLASTGTPSFSMHPGEAFHGDLGMVHPSDIFVAISNSGETEELLKLLPFLRDNGNCVIAITKNKNSTLGLNSWATIEIAVPEEACPHQLAPTASTTATLAVGDALTVALMELRRFTPENFARFHPGGSLGRRLLSKVKDEMLELPISFLNPTSTFTEIVSSISQGKLGFAIVYDEKTKKYSVITDGDLRRAMDHYGKDVFSIKAKDIASGMPHTVSHSASMEHAYSLMDKHKIGFLLAVDNEELVGVLKK